MRGKLKKILPRLLEFAVLVFCALSLSIEIPAILIALLRA